MLPYLSRWSVPLSSLCFCVLSKDAWESWLALVVTTNLYIKPPKDTSGAKQVKENPSLRMPPEVHTSGDAVACELENHDEQFCISPHGQEMQSCSSWEMEFKWEIESTSYLTSVDTHALLKLLKWIHYLAVNHWARYNLISDKVITFKSLWNWYDFWYVFSSLSGAVSVAIFKFHCWW